MARRVFPLLLAASTGIAGAISVPATAFAQEGEPQCRPDREGALDHFQRAYGEVPVARALTSTGALLEVLAKPDGSTWSVILTFPDGSRTCLVSAGENWRPVAPVSADPRA